MDQTFDAASSSSSNAYSWSADDDSTSFGELPPMDLDDISMNYDPSLYQQAVDEFVRQMEAGDDYSSDSGSDAGMSSSSSSVDSFDELIEQFDGLPNEVVAEFVKTCCAGCLPEDGKQDFDFEALLESIPAFPLSHPISNPATAATVSVTN